MFSSCLSLSTYYRVLQTENISKKDVEKTNPENKSNSISKDNCTCWKIKQKLLINSHLTQPVIPNMHAKTHHFITDQKKPKNL